MEDSHALPSPLALLEDRSCRVLPFALGNGSIAEWISKLCIRFLAGQVLPVPVCVRGSEGETGPSACRLARSVHQCRERQGIREDCRSLHKNSMRTRAGTSHGRHESRAKPPAVRPVLLSQWWGSVNVTAPGYSTRLALLRRPLFRSTSACGKRWPKRTVPAANANVRGSICWCVRRRQQIGRKNGPDCAAPASPVSSRRKEVPKCRRPSRYRP